MDPYPEIELARMNDRKRTFYDARFTMSNTNECTSSFVYRRNGTFVETRPDSSRQVRSFVFVHVLCFAGLHATRFARRNAFTVTFAQIRVGRGGAKWRWRYVVFLWCAISARNRMQCAMCTSEISPPKREFFRAKSVHEAPSFLKFRYILRVSKSFRIFLNMKNESPTIRDMWLWIIIALLFQSDLTWIPFQ